MALKVIIIILMAQLAAVPVFAEWEFYPGRFEMTAPSRPDESASVEIGGVLLDKTSGDAFLLIMDTKGQPFFAHTDRVRWDKNKK